MPTPEVIGAAISRNFGHPHADVLSLEAHVHDIVFVVHILAREFREFSRLVVDLYAADHISGQIVERGLDVSVEEILAADEQVVNALTVDFDFSIVQFGPRKLLHEFSERFRLGQVKSIGIIYDCVAPVEHLDARSSDLSLAKLLLLGAGDEIDGRHFHLRFSIFRHHLAAVFFKTFCFNHEHIALSGWRDKRKRRTAVFVDKSVAPMVASLGDELIARGVGCKNGFSIHRHEAHNGTAHAFTRQHTADVAFYLDFLGCST